MAKHCSSSSSSTSTSPSTPRFENLLNFRDVGQFINHYTGKQLLKPGLLYRSARPDEATPHDRSLLLDHYKIRTIIDLRTKSEHLEQARKHAASITTTTTTTTTSNVDSATPASSAAIGAADLPTNPSPSNPPQQQPFQIPGICYRNLNLNGWAYSRHLLSQLKYWSLTKLLFLMATGYRIPAINILGSQVMAQRGLDGLAEDTLVHCTAEMKELMTLLGGRRGSQEHGNENKQKTDTVARQTHDDDDDDDDDNDNDNNNSSWPVLIHCTQGKDRTGIIILLLLLLVLTPDPSSTSTSTSTPNPTTTARDQSIMQAINADYTLSATELQPERDQRLHEIRAIGLPDSFADCPPHWIEHVVAFVDARYGGPEAYLLRACGVDSRSIARIRRTMSAV